MLLVSAAFANIWLPHAFLFALSWLGTGCLLGAIGLAVTRWEMTPASLHYTPNRWLVLVITSWSRRAWYAGVAQLACLEGTGGRHILDHITSRTGSAGRRRVERCRRTVTRRPLTVSGQ